MNVAARCLQCKEPLTFDTSASDEILQNPMGRVHVSTCPACGARNLRQSDAPHAQALDAGDPLDHKQRRHDAHERAAETHERAARLHDEAAETFRAHEREVSADREQELAAKERKRAESAHDRAQHELDD